MDELELLMERNAQLEAENAQLKRDQDLIFLVMDMGLKVVEEWAKENNLLLPAGKNPKQDFTKRSSQIRVFFKQIRKAEQDALFDRLVGLLDRLEKR